MQAPKRSRSCSGPETSGKALCWRHSRPLDIYCCTDQQIICAACASAEHTGHTIGMVRQEREREQEELRNLLTKTQQTLKKQEKKWKDMGKTLEVIEEEARKTKDHCECILVEVMDSLQRHFLSLRDMISTQEEAAAAQVQTSLRTLQVQMEELQKRDAELDCLALTDDVRFLQKWPSLKYLCSKDQLHHLNETSEDPLLPFALTKRTVEQLGRQLKEFCDNQFSFIYQTGLPEVNSTLTHQEAEPKTRAEFLQYACRLTFDPHTAHEDLVISTGDKEVRLSPQTFKSPAVRHPERFAHRRQLLCREGLQAERCYYEVEIRGDKVEIALAYKSLDRKSRTSLSAFGANAKSWSLDRSTNYSVSHRADSVQLTTPPTQKRVGVYLKFREGTLSFYEVSDTMTFLYTVQAQFKEPLYPGFWLGEECCIKICDLGWHTL
ncbi:tripartite motif-containing protein 16-like [Labrus mixtus]|uniref:tripartite motif-containing protein 16-like n=1 Tax=Labrus mixtus TaxID=508554 RepID=UPI0029C07E03|nr:tripartite motif-containing protein 16-like [Labrus mixtus]